MAAAVRGLVEHVIGASRWLNPAPNQEVQMEARVVPGGMAAVLLQRNPAALRTWLPVSCWGRKLEALE